MPPLRGFPIGLRLQHFYTDTVPYGTEEVFEVFKVSV